MSAPRGGKGGGLAEFITALASGDDDAWKKLDARYGCVVFWHVFPQIQDWEDTKDLVQDVYTKAYGALKRAYRQGDPLPHHPGPWLRKIATNLVKDRFRRRRRQKRGIEPLMVDLDQAKDIHTSDLAKGIEDKLEAERILAKVSLLPETTRLVICLRLFQSLSDRDIAKRLGISVRRTRRLMNEGMAAIGLPPESDHD